MPDYVEKRWATGGLSCQDPLFQQVLLDKPRTESNAVLAWQLTKLADLEASWRSACRIECAFDFWQDR